VSQLPHLQLVGGVTGVPFARPVSAMPAFRTPPRDRVGHARALQQGIEGAIAAAQAEHQQEGSEAESRGVQLALESQQGYDLRLESLENRRAGIQLLQATTKNGVQRAVVFVPRAAYGLLSDRIREYEQETTAGGAPKNRLLVESIDRVRLAIAEDLWADAGDFPRVDAPLWWEVWLPKGDQTGQSVYDSLIEHCYSLGWDAGRRFLEFSERVVTMVKARSSDWSRSRAMLELIAELRAPVEPALPYLDLHPREQAEWVRDVQRRLRVAHPEAPAVCLLDSGVNREHPLLQDSLLQSDWQSVDPTWGPADGPEHHGTCMAGTALFGDLADVLRATGPVALAHRLESVRILPRAGANPPELYGSIFSQAVSLAEISAPNRNRTMCLAVTAKEASGIGAPSSWSAAVDQAAFGDGDDTRLVVVSAGNLRLLDGHYRYPETNHTSECALEDPSQSWNCLTVGACTERIRLSAEYDGWTAIAPAGGLTPSSRTSAAWDSDQRSPWPLKPDVVFEGGNWIVGERGTRSPCPETHLLTTAVHPTGALFDTNADTSAAAAQAARLAAIIQARYPNLRAETVRALLVHSAEWTDAMRRLVPADGQVQVMKRIRTFGFGVPSIERALYSLTNAVTLVAEGAIQPYRRGEGGARANQMVLHELPWPTDALYDLGNVRVRMRVTLSYFIEPNPGRRGMVPKTRYASHGLRFDVKRPGETVEVFKQRLSAAERDDPDAPIDTVGETRNWVLGVNGRARGSLQCDWWEGTAEQLAASDCIAVFPVTGWWKERPHLGRLERAAPYSLVVSIETPTQTVDLYSIISAQAVMPVQVAVQ
jgi:hypothetical protein